MATVTLRKLRKRYGRGPPVLEGLDLDIADGEFLTLVGPSGCGKSTTLNLLAGLEDSDGGEILIDGRRVNELAPGERDVAMVFQSYALYPHLDVRTNLAFPLEVQGAPKEVIAQRVKETASRLGIEALLGRKPRELSGGQRQRVALGRALVRRPKLFLFDEPLSNLDAALRTRMRGELKKLHEELKATFVYVTHDQAEAMTLSDRVAVLDRGALQQVATPREIYRSPANLFVARFFGAPPINELGPALLRAANRETAPGVVVAVRPEDVEIGVGAAPQGAVVGTVYLVEPMGAETFVTVEVGGERIAARADREIEVAPGTKAWVRWPSEREMRFDAESGKARG